MSEYCENSADTVSVAAAMSFLLRAATSDAQSATDSQSAFATIASDDAIAPAGASRPIGLAAHRDAVEIVELALFHVAGALSQSTTVEAEDVQYPFAAVLSSDAASAQDATSVRVTAAGLQSVSIGELASTLVLHRCADIARTLGRARGYAWVDSQDEVQVVETQHVSALLWQQSDTTVEVSDQQSFRGVIHQGTVDLGSVQDSQAFWVHAFVQSREVVYVQGRQDLPGVAYSAPTDSMALTRWLVSAQSATGEYIAADRGVARMAGATDYGQPFTPAIRSRWIDCSPGVNLQRPDNIYMLVRSPDPLTVSVGNNESGTEQTYHYLTVDRIADVPTPTRTKVGRGFRSRYMRLGISGAAPWSVRDVVIQLLETGRRV